jgi:cellulose biosynthesis protein BcsQ
MMLLNKTEKPSIRDVYHRSIGPASEKFFKAIRETKIPFLHIVTSENALCNEEVHDPYLLQKCIHYMKLQRFYDFVLIDNATGIDTLQIASIHAADSVFVPTELKQFAINGLCELEDVLCGKYPDDPTVTRIIPMFFRDVKEQRQNLDKLKELFPGRVTNTVIPYDRVFEELLTEKKVLFLHRLFSKAAAYYLKIIPELFDVDEITMWETMQEKRKECQSREARERFYSQQQQKSTEWGITGQPTWQRI